MFSVLNHTRFWCFLVTGLLLTFGCSESADEPTQPTKQVGVDTRTKTPKNLLFIAVDTLRADHLGTYGFKRNTSENIDRLFAQSSVFTEAQSTAPWTLPSFASMMTSQQSSTHGCWQFSDKLDASFVTLAEQLKTAGYHTGGVVGHIFLGTKYGLAQGFDDYDQTLVKDNFGESHKAITSHIITEKSIEFLEQHVARQSDAPFFLLAHYFDPHNTYQAHAGITKNFGKNRRALYDGEIAYTDQFVGELLNHLNKLGLSEDTVVVFVADHGEEFRDHGRILHGQTLYREVLRVPMAIKVPGTPPLRVTQPVSVVDLMPTLLEVLNVPAPSTPMAGRSLIALMRGEPSTAQDVLMESRLGYRKDAELEGIIHGDWKLIIEKPRTDAAGNPPENTESVAFLFNWKTDPKEKKNMAEQHPEIVASLQKKIAVQVASAEQLRSHFKIPETLSHTPSEIEQLHALGYVVSEDDEP
jgi:arylsulfatase A-like enzyme